MHLTTVTYLDIFSFHILKSESATFSVLHWKYVSLSLTFPVLNKHSLNSSCFYEPKFKEVQLELCRAGSQILAILEKYIKSGGISGNTLNTGTVLEFWGLSLKSRMSGNHIILSSSRVAKF